MSTAETERKPHPWRQSWTEEDSGAQRARVFESLSIGALGLETALVKDGFWNLDEAAMARPVIVLPVQREEDREKWITH